MRLFWRSSLTGALLHFIFSLCFARNITVPASSGLASSFPSSGLLAPSRAVPSRQNNVTSSACWNYWTDYWSSLANTANISYSTSYSLFTLTDTQTFPAKSPYTSTLDGVYVITTTILNAQFTIATELATLTQSPTTVTQTSAAAYTTTIIRTVQADATNVPLISTPPCALPSYLPVCQTSWESYIAYTTQSGHILSDYTQCTPAIEPSCVTSVSAYQSSVQSYLSRSSALSPACAQASIGGTACEDLRTSYISLWSTASPTPGNLNVRSRGYTRTMFTIDGTLSFAWMWPTTSGLAPSCTIGCVRCAVTGGTIQVLYWPPMSSTPAPDRPITMKTLNTTLTYPTLYVSYGTVYASDSCSAIGPTITDTIVPIPTSAGISSIYGEDVRPIGPYGNQLPVTVGTAPFNISDLLPPVPYSIYSRQPWCATYLGQHNPLSTIIGNQTIDRNITCPTTEPYKPILVLPSAILNSMDPLWASCSGDIRGVYDPPIALTAVESAVVPTPSPTSPVTSEFVPNIPSSLQPGSVASSPWPSPTAQTSPAFDSFLSPSQQGANPPTASPHDPSSPSSKAPPNDPSSPSSKSPNNAESDRAGTATIVFGPSDSGGSGPSAAAVPPAVSALVQGSQGNGIASAIMQMFPTPTQTDASTLTAAQLGSSIIVFGQGTSTTIALGSQATIGGHVISAAATNNVVVDGSSVVPLLPAKTPVSIDATITAANGDRFDAMASGNVVTISQSGSAITLAPSQVSVINGHTFSLDGSRGVVVDGSKTVTLPSSTAASMLEANTPGSVDATIAAANGDHFTARVSGSAMIISKGGSAMTLAPSQVSVFNGHTFSLDGSRGVVVDGSKTFTISSSTATLTAPQSPQQTVATQLSSSVRSTISSASPYTGSGATLRADDMLPLLFAMVSCYLSMYLLLP